MRLTRDGSHLSAYLDEMLTGPEMAAVREQAHREPETRQQLLALQSTVAVLRRLPDPDPHPDFWPRALHRLRAYARLEARRATWRQFTRYLLGASLCVVAGLGLWGLLSGHL